MESGKSRSPEWVNGETVAAALGCSIKHLAKLRESKRIIKGKHWRDISPATAKRPTYRYNLTAIERLFNERGN
jgi:hypothetical protein